MVVCMLCGADGETGNTSAGRQVSGSGGKVQRLLVAGEEVKVY